MLDITLKEIEPGEPEAPEVLAGLWNAAMGAEWAITPRAARYGLLPSDGVIRAGRLAEVNGLPAGFVLAEAVENRSEGSINALAVDPRFQGQGVGTALLNWSDGWLADRRVREAWLGGGERTWIPGLPDEDEHARSRDFFIHRGFTQREKTWDLARSLKDYARPQLSHWPPAEIRPARAEDLPALFDLLAQDFDYWLSDYRQFFADGGRPEDIIVLYAGEKLKAFCWTTRADSARPIERFFPNSLRQPWGQLGSIGTAEDSRGRGYAGVMIDFALRHLQALGIDGCVIDWTGYLDFYAKFGFAPYHAYRLLKKSWA